MGQKKRKRSEDKKRILIVSTFFLPKLGGVEVYNKELFSRLLDTYDIDLICCNTQRVAKQQKIDGINTYRLDCWNVFGSALPTFWSHPLRAMKSLHKKRQYDLVVTQTRFFVLSFLGAYFAKKNKIKHLHIEHGGAPLSHKNPLIKLMATLFDLTLGRYVIKKAWKVAGISQNTQKFVKTFGRKSELILYNGVDTKRFTKAKRNTLHKKFNIPKHATVIGYVGRLVQAKGVQHLVQFYMHLPASLQQNTYLIIGGDGPQLSELKVMCALYPNIIFIGFVQPQDVPELLCSCDIFVNPSYNEGLPTTVLEAGAAGCQVIATDVGGTREIITSKRHGYLIRPKSTKAITNVLIDALNKKNSNKQLQRFITKTFDWDVLAKKFRKEVKF